MYCVIGTLRIYSFKFDILFKSKIKIAPNRILKKILKDKNTVKEEEQRSKKSTKKEYNIISATRSMWSYDR